MTADEVNVNNEAPRERVTEVHHTGGNGGSGWAVVLVVIVIIVLAILAVRAGWLGGDNDGGSIESNINLPDNNGGTVPNPTPNPTPAQ